MLLDFVCALAEALSAHARAMPPAQRVIGTARWVLDGVVQRHLVDSGLVPFAMSRGPADDTRDLALPRLPPISALRGHVCIVSAEPVYGGVQVASGVAVFDDDGATAAISCASRAVTISVTPRGAVCVGFEQRREPVDTVTERVDFRSDDAEGGPLFALLRAIAGTTASATALVGAYPAAPGFDERRGADASSVIFTVFARAASLAILGEQSAAEWSTLRRCFVGASDHDARAWVAESALERERIQASTQKLNAQPDDPCPRCRARLVDGGPPTAGTDIDALGEVRTPIDLVCPACLIRWRSYAVRIDDFRDGTRRYT